MLRLLLLFALTHELPTYKNWFFRSITSKDLSRRVFSGFTRMVHADRNSLHLNWVMAVCHILCRLEMVWRARCIVYYHQHVILSFSESFESLTAGLQSIRRPIFVVSAHTFYSCHPTWAYAQIDLYPFKLYQSESWHFVVHVYRFVVYRGGEVLSGRTVYRGNL